MADLTIGRRLNNLPHKVVSDRSELGLPGGFLNQGSAAERACCCVWLWGRLPNLRPIVESATFRPQSIRPIERHVPAASISVAPDGRFDNRPQVEQPAPQPLRYAIAYHDTFSREDLR